jgi:hypothetical protein
VTATDRESGSSEPLPQEDGVTVNYHRASFCVIVSLRNSDHLRIFWIDSVSYMYFADGGQIFFFFTHVFTAGMPCSLLEKSFSTGYDI